MRMLIDMVGGEQSGDRSIVNELEDAKKEYDRLLSILAKAVSKKYEIQGYSTGYAIGITGVQVTFQEIGSDNEELYYIDFVELVRY